METKPGYKTTEFWLTLLTNLVGSGGILTNVINPEIGLAVVAIANAVYSLIRSIFKKKGGQ